MKSYIKVAVIAMVAIAIVGVATGCAYSFRHKSPQERAEWIVKNISEELKLNDTQLDKLNALKDELLTVRSDYRKKRSETQKTVGELLSQPALDQQRVLTLIKERTQEVNEKAPQIVAAFAAFYDSLKPEQQEKLRHKITEMMEHHHGYWSDD